VQSQHPLADRWLRKAALVTAVVTLAYAAAALLAGRAEISLALDQVSLEQVLIVLLLVSTGYAWRTCRWLKYCAALGATIAPRQNTLYYLAGFAFAATPAKAGEAFRGIYLRRHGVSYAQSLGMVMAERGLDVLVMGLISLLLLTWFSGTSTWITGLFACSVVVTLVLAHRHVARLVAVAGQRLPEGRIRKLVTTLSDSIAAVTPLTSVRSLAGGISLGTLAWISEGVAFWLLAQAFGIHLPVPLALGIYAASILLGTLSFLPGGIGGSEAAMILFLGATGASIPAAVAFVLLFRILTLWYAVLLGFLAMGVVRLRSATWRTG
jgi:uncharacterized protein (TIRG00374 family)